jgi:hypothetical protein
LTPEPDVGRLITETLEFDGGRQVTAFVPTTPPEAIVFAGDGQLIASWGDALEVAELPPTMIVGAHRLEDETLRIQEYSPGESTAAFAFDPERFAAHERFFVEDVRRWSRSRFGVDHHLPRCRARSPAPTSSPARRSPSSSTTRPGGRTRCATRARMW